MTPQDRAKAIQDGQRAFAALQASHHYAYLRDAPQEQAERLFLPIETTTEHREAFRLGWRAASEGASA